MYIYDLESNNMTKLLYKNCKSASGLIDVDSGKNDRKRNKICTAYSVIMNHFLLTMSIADGLQKLIFFKILSGPVFYSLPELDNCEKSYSLYCFKYHVQFTVQYSSSSGPVN